MLGCQKFVVDMVSEDSVFCPLQMTLRTSVIGRQGLAPTVRSFGVLE